MTASREKPGFFGFFRSSRRFFTDSLRICPSMANEAYSEYSRFGVNFSCGKRPGRQVGFLAKKVRGGVLARSDPVSSKEGQRFGRRNSCLEARQTFTKRLDCRFSNKRNRILILSRKFVTLASRTRVPFCLNLYFGNGRSGKAWA